MGSDLSLGLKKDVNLFKTCGFKGIFYLLIGAKVGFFVMKELWDGIGMLHFSILKKGRKLRDKDRLALKINGVILSDMERDRALG